MNDVIEKKPEGQYRVIATASLEAMEHLRSGLLNAELAYRIEENCKDGDETPFFIHRALVKNSVISSVCALEANINEWFSSFESIAKEASAKAGVINQLWSLGIPRTAKYSIIEKYQIALTLLGVEKLNPGTNPYQSAKKIVKLRNALVHYEPTFEPDSNQSQKGEFKSHSLGKELAGLFELNPVCAEWAPMWPTKLLGAGCAKWCSETALDFMEEFHRRDTSEVPGPMDRKQLLENTQYLADTDWGNIFSNNRK